jgi:hypothetical protein
MVLVTVSENISLFNSLAIPSVILADPYIVAQAWDTQVDYRCEKVKMQVYYKCARVY